MENNNSVCFVARINEIKPIEDADKIELAVIGGWNCIVQKGHYVENDLTVVATTDAVIPQELSDAMNVTSYLRKGQRVRTVKLRGVYSECLLIPLKHVPLMENYYDGKDMMFTMNIYKYEPPARQVQLSSGRKIKYKDNENFKVYYKFPNLKNVPELFTEKDKVEITRKIHGTNARYGIVKKSKLSIWDRIKRFFGNEWIEYEYVYGSHNVEKGSDSQGFYGTDVWKTIADRYNIKEKLWKFFKTHKEHYKIKEGIIIYGEIYGPGIQKGYDYGLKETEYAGFDVTINGEYQATVRSFVIHNMLDLNHVPVLEFSNWSDELLTKYTFDKIEGTKIPHEGVVIKAEDGNRNKVAKVINPDYLIYGEKHNIGDSH
jgi:RNA ligase (TIGR02306 family)